MDDHASPNPLLRRKSIAGPYMRSSMGIPAEHRPAGEGATASSASTAAAAPPAPLTRANTHSGGWFGSWFGTSTSISNSASVIPRTMDASEDNYAHLASSAPQVLPPKADSRESLLHSTGGPHPAAALPAAGQSPAAATGAAPPPLARRLSEVALQRPGSKSGAVASSPTNGAASITSTSPVKPSLLETDIRQGPIETDLFWLVLRDIGE